MTVHVVGSMDRLEWGQVSFWWRSLMCTGFDGEVHMLVRNCREQTHRELLELGIHTHDVNSSNFQIVVERFSALRDLCLSLPPDDWVVACDTTDIIFQKDPTGFLEYMSTDYSLVVASETISFEHNDWAKRNLKVSFPEWWDELSGALLYNAGSIAGLAGDLAELSDDIVKHCYLKPDAKNHDQAAMNWLLRQDKYRNRTLFTKALDGWCYCCASTVFAKPHEKPHLEEPLPDIRDGLCYMPDGGLACLFHHYDRGPSLKRAACWAVERDWQAFAVKDSQVPEPRIPAGLPHFPSLDEMHQVPDHQPRQHSDDLEQRVGQLETLVEQLLADRPIRARRLR